MKQEVIEKQRIVKTIVIQILFRRQGFIMIYIIPSKLVIQSKYNIKSDNVSPFQRILSARILFFI